MLRNEKRKRFVEGACVIVTVLSLLVLGGCQKQETVKTEEEAQVIEEVVMQEKMIMKIDDTYVDVSWEDNESVDALRQIVKEKGELRIDMSRYGGFEQVGEIGERLPDSDTQLSSEAGDIFLYASDNIVVFYGSNTWSYTRLGKMNASQEELRGLLSDHDVVLTLSFE